MLQRVLNIFFFLVITGLAAGMVWMYTNRPKTAYVELGKVYNEFQFKKELESKFKNVQEMRKTMLDSLQLELRVLSSEIGNGKSDKKSIEHFNNRRDEYLLKEQQFTEDNQVMASQYMEEVTKQLNQYVQDFGKEKGYTYILGAEGSGAIMYAENAENITESVVVYLNQRYSGKP